LAECGDGPHAEHAGDDFGEFHGYTGYVVFSKN
jgi:hypothetical protein